MRIIASSVAVGGVGCLLMLAYYDQLHNLGVFPKFGFQRCIKSGHGGNLIKVSPALDGPIFFETDSLDLKDVVNDFIPGYDYPCLEIFYQ